MARCEEDAVPVLTTISDPVSVQVAAFYAESPYPSYQRIPKVAQAMSPSRLVSALNSWARVEPQAWDDAPSVLVAGCGTGQQAFRVAQTFPGAQVTAIDISRASLAYAIEKYKESGLTNIEFAIADILKLPSTGRRFDVIEVVGVLHHMADPWAGFRALLSALNPKGLMRCALYSSTVREFVYAIRNLAMRQGFTGGRQDVERFREVILQMPPHPLLDMIRNSPDFQTIDALRDLVFHPHERPVTIAEISEQLALNRLRFLGFCFHKPDPIKASFHERGYGREDDLLAWDRMEKEQRFVFTGMYDFWAQKQ